MSYHAKPRHGRLPAGTPEARKEALLIRFQIMARKSLYRYGGTRRTTGYEYDHWVADQLLLEFINDEQITEAFDSIEKMYG